MPLSEFLRLAMEKLEASKKKSCSINDSSIRENSLVEVVWENGPTHHSFSPNTPSFPDSATASLGGVDLSPVAPSGPWGYHSECSPQDSYVPTMANFEDTFMETDKALPQSNTDNSTLVIDGDTSAEPIVAADGASYEQKRKLCDIEFECRNDDFQHDSIGEEKATRCTGSKRSRTTEVHNLSERRRRDRINEKMRALQELIPNCNKADKASMLDDAIQYLKNLQYQLHIMSTGGGLCMPPMMFPSQHMYPAPMPHFSPMSFENINNGSHPRPIFPVPSIRGAHFPASTLGHMYFQGISGPHFPIHRTHPRAPPAVSPLAASSTQNKASSRSSNLDFEDPLCSKNSLNMNL